MKSQCKQSIPNKNHKRSLYTNAETVSIIFTETNPNITEPTAGAKKIPQDQMAFMEPLVMRSYRQDAVQTQRDKSLRIMTANGQRQVWFVF